MHQATITINTNTDTANNSRITTNLFRIDHENDNERFSNQLWAKLAPGGHGHHPSSCM